MISCVIMHNIINKNDHTNVEPLFDLANVSQLRCGLAFQTYMENIEELENSHTLQFKDEFGKTFVNHEELQLI